MQPLRKHRLSLDILAGSAGGLAVALVLQYGFNMAPCPLCVLQRLALVVTALIAVLRLFAPAQLKPPIAWAGVIASLGGFGLAAWHVFKVVVPSEEVTCGPGLGTWVDSLWTAEVLPSLFAPMGDCFQDAANLFGLPLPAYACGLFLALAFLFRLNAINASTTLNS